MRRQSAPSMKPLQYVSIHAPTRGATVFTNSDLAPSNVSIHAPTRGATLHLIEPIDSIEVSIHAPTRGATAGNPYIAGR